MKKWGRRALSLVTAAAVSMVTVLGNGQTIHTMAATTDESGKVYLSDEDIQALTVKTEYTFTRNSVHDPSVVDGKNGYYYVFGSHMGVSKTADLMNWTSVATESTNSSLFGMVNEDGSISPVSYNQAFRSNQSNRVTVLVDGVPAEVDLGTFDASAWNTARSNFTVQGNMWAPDVVYNDTMNKWCMYLSLNGDRWNSVIILLTADSVEGPYVYQGPVVYSGFSNSVAACSFKNSDLELVIGQQDALPEKYNKADNGKWGNQWPHAIDPCVFYDSEGKLWMTYGSWSGGIYILELDETNGLRDYTVAYESDYDTLGEGVTSDAYFGKKIAGGYYVSGEGSYIQKIGDYYYLFMSYGFYSPEGGYQMRIFRSQNPDGPYMDTTGVSAVYDRRSLNYTSESGTINDYRGERLMTNYQWNTMSVPEVSQGHNSAIVDAEGRAYVVYHTKFDDGTVGHELRVHELFINADGWLVAAPYEFTKDPKVNMSESYETAELAGDYEVIIHHYQLGYDKNETNKMGVTKPVSLTLHEDGTVSGAFSGTWSEDAGTAYVTLVLDGKIYKGVFARQTVDTTGMKTMCFSVVDEASGLNIWGSKNVSDAAIVALNVTTADVAVPSKTYTDITLPASGVQGASISWTSSNEVVLSSTGKIGTVAEPTVVSITKTVSKGNYIYQKDYQITVMPPQTGEKVLVASYFAEPVNLAEYIDGTLFVPNPFYEKTTAGLDLSGGVTVEFDVVPTGDVHTLGTILAFGDSGKLYFTPGSYLGYNATGGYFDANIKDFSLVNDYIGNAYAASGDAVHVELVFDQAGYDVLINGELAYDETIQKTENGAGDLTNYKKVLNWLQNTAAKTYFGHGSWWNSAGFDEANILLSNVNFYANGTENAASVNGDYGKMERKVLNLSSNDYMEKTANPFYGKELEELYVDYTINFSTDAAKNGWDGIFAFYNSATGGRVSFQTAPYICYNEETGNWMDVKTVDGADMYAFKHMEKGRDYHVTLMVTKDNAKFFVDGKELAVDVSGNGVDYSNLLSYISDCDQFTWGVGQAGSAYWWTEICTVKDITIASAHPITVKAEEVHLSSNDAYTEIENPAYGIDAKALNIKYTINWAENAAKNGWDGIFAFYNSATGGRISVQTAPYICYNEATVNWMDLNGAGSDTNVAPQLASGVDYTFELTVTEEEIHFFLDGTEIETTVTGSGATYENLLEYIAECDKFTWGVGQGISSYWWTELCTLKNVDVTVYTLDDLIKETTPTEPETPVVEDINRLGTIEITEDSLSLDELVLGSSDAIFQAENPFYGQDTEELTLEYTINMNADAAKNGWDGILSFYQTNALGRISVQTAPYVCYNDMDGNWMDVNQPGAEGSTDMAPGFAAGTDHTVRIVITATDMKIFVDGDEILYSVAGSETASFESLLAFLAECDGLSFGVGLAETSFWNTELCTVKNLTLKAVKKAEVKNGAYEEDGVIRLYIDGELIEKENAYKVVNGEKETYYYVSSDGTVQTGIQYISSKKLNGTGLTANYYHIRNDGSIMTDTGIVSFEEGFYEDGTIRYSEKTYYVIDGIVQKSARLIKFGEDYYYVAYDGSVYQNRFYKITGKDEIESGKYYFDADGKMHVGNGTECFNVDGERYLLDNGMLLENEGLVKVGEDYYYSRYDGKAVIDKTYLITRWYKDADTTITGKQKFGDDGKMIVRQ